MAVSTPNQLIDPELLLQKTQLQPGMRMADFGCGRTGHLVFPAARLVGERGIIYAVDILPEVLQTIAKRAQTENCLNLHTVWSNIEQTGKTAIPEHSLDAVFLINVLSNVRERGRVLAEAKRLIKDKGRLMVVDWSSHRLSFSPPPDQLVNMNELISEARTLGFVLQETFSAGTYHQGAVFYIHE